MREFKHIISFSGGMGSFAEAVSCVEKYGKEKVLLLFADTLMEDEDLYRFLDETVSFLGCEFERICYGKTPWELFEAKRFVGGSKKDLCSEELKRNFIKNWLIKEFGYWKQENCLDYIGNIQTNSCGVPITKGVLYINAEVHLGIDYTEEHRIRETKERVKPWIYRSTLVEDGRFIPKDFSLRFGIEPPRLYKMGFSHNNCGGFCVKAGLGHFKNLYEKLPERYKEHEETEIRLKTTLNTKPFLKKRISGQPVRYITMKEYREEFLEKGKAEEDKFDIGGCACALP